MKTSNSGRTSISGKTKTIDTEIENGIKPTDQKPIWDEIEAIIRFTESDYAVSEVKKYVEEVEKAAYERGKAEQLQEIIELSDSVNIQELLKIRSKL